MKLSTILRIVKSLLLIVLTSTAFSYVIAGDFSIADEAATVLFGAGMIKGILNLHVPYAGVLLYDGFTINDTTYAGEAASSFIVKAITGNDTVQGGHVYVKDGIKHKFTIPRWDADYEDFIQDRAATPVSKGNMTVDGVALQPRDYMIYTEFNPRDFESHWFATQLNPTLIDRTLPASVESIVIQEVLKRHDKYFNKALWNNSTALSTIYKYWDGFLKRAADATDANEVSSPAALTVNNIQAELLKGYQAIPAALRYDPDMKFYMSYSTFDLYMQSQINQTYKGVDTTSEGIARFKGRQCVKIADFPDDIYVIARGNATPGSNLWVGLNSTDDAKLELSRLQNNSELWFIKMNMKVDCQIGWTSEIVTYGL